MTVSLRLENDAARSARCLPPSPVAGLVRDSLPPPGPGPGAKDNMASVRRTLASPYRNLPTPRVASTGGSGIGDGSAIRAITLKSNLGRAARPNRTDRIAGVSSGNPSQWAYAIRTPSDGSRHPWLGPSSPLRVPLKGSKHVTFVQLWELSLQPASLRWPSREDLHPSLP